MTPGAGAEPPTVVLRTIDGAAAPDARHAWTRAEFDHFYRAGCPPLVAQLHVVWGDPRRADAAARTAFVTTWRHWPQVRAQPDPSGWTRRVGMQTRRTRWWRRRPLRIGPRPEHLDTASRSVLDALARVPVVQRRALVLRYMAGLNEEQLAVEENTAPEVIGTRLAHGALALTGHLVDRDPARTSPIVLLDDNGTARTLQQLQSRLVAHTTLPPVASILPR